jgi:hypothetical protein
VWGKLQVLLTTTQKDKTFGPNFCAEQKRLFIENKSFSVDVTASPAEALFRGIATS